MNRFEPPPLPGDSHAADQQNPYATPAPGAADRTSAQTSGYPVQGYAQPYSQPYGAAPQAPWGPAAAYAHPRGTLVLVLGILSIVVAPVFGPFAWVMGRKALREVDAAPHATSNRSTLQAGTILGIIGTVLMVIGLLAIVAFVSFVMIASVGVEATGGV